MTILYEDDSIIVIKKDAAEPVQTSKASSPDIVSMLKKHLSQSLKKKGEIYLGIVHRLDQPVEGLLVFAKTKEAAANLSKQFATDIPHKHYLALVEGTVDVPINENHELTGYICKISKENRACMVKDCKDRIPGGDAAKPCSLIFSPIEIRNETTLLSIVLQTGRFHQIRAQLSDMGHPIAGDRKYGSSIEYKQDFLNGNCVQKGAIALKADSLSFYHPVSGKKMEMKMQ